MMSWGHPDSYLVLAHPSPLSGSVRLHGTPTVTHVSTYPVLLSPDIKGPDGMLVQTPACVLPCPGSPRVPGMPNAT